MNATSVMLSSPCITLRLPLVLQRLPLVLQRLPLVILSVAKNLLFAIILLSSVPAHAAIKPSTQSINVLHYKIFLQLNEVNLEFGGNVGITFRSTATKALKQVWFHSEGFEIVDVLMDDQKLKYRVKKDRIVVQLPQPLQKHEEATVQISYVDGKASTREQEGLFVIQQKDRLPAFYTQFESQAARKAFPCYDEPFDKATTEVSLQANPRYRLLSNGSKTDEQIIHGRRLVTFTNPDPISTYHITFVAAELDAVVSHHRSSDGRMIPLTIYTGRGRANEAQVAMHALRETMSFYEDYFDRPYPWKEYGIVAVEGFTWGGMENKGLTNMNAYYLYWSPDRPYAQQANIFLLVAHELAHEWFGNLVTMQWWHDLWLNEAFATFMEHKLLEHVFGNDHVRVGNFEWLNIDYFPQDQGPLAHPIVVKNASTVGELFDGVTYAKGVQVVRMLESLVGPTNFQRAIQAYMQRFALGNATTAQFLETIEATTGVTLKGFAKAWLHQKGFPQIHVATAWNAQVEELSVVVEQSTERGGRVRTPFVGVLPIGLIGDDYYRQVDVGISDATEIFSVDLPSAPRAVSVNRDGSFLGQYILDGEDLTIETLLNEESSGIVRASVVHRLLLGSSKGETVIAAVQQALTDRSLPVRNSVMSSLLHIRHSKLWIQTIARAVQRELLLNLRRNPKEPIAAMLQTYSLTLLGEADDPDYYSLLHARLGSPVADIQVGALAGLLRTSAPGRFTSFMAMVRGAGRDSSRTLEMLRVLARTPDPAIFTHLGSVLADPQVIPTDDSSTPVRVLRTLRQENRDTVYSQEGIAFIADIANRNIDRPSIAAAALRTLEGIKDAPRGIRSTARKAIRDVLSQSTDKLVASVGKKVLRAVN